MRAEKIADSSKIMIGVFGLVLSLVLVSSSMMALNGESAPYAFTSFRTAGDSHSSFLEDFAFLPGSAVVVEERYVLALYENAKNGLFAVAMFTANCEAGGCPIGDFMGYSIVDPSQSQQVFYANLDRM